MRYGIFVNKFLVADFPDGERSAAIQEAWRRQGEFVDFRTGESRWPSKDKMGEAMKVVQEIRESLP